MFEHLDHRQYDHGTKRNRNKWEREHRSQHDVRKANRVQRIENEIDETMIKGLMLKKTANRFNATVATLIQNKFTD